MGLRELDFACWPRMVLNDRPRFRITEATAHGMKEESEEKILAHILLRLGGIPHFIWGLNPDNGTPSMNGNSSSRDLRIYPSEL